MPYYSDPTGFKAIDPATGQPVDIINRFLLRDWFVDLQDGFLYTQGTNTLGQLGTGDTLTKTTRTSQSSVTTYKFYNSISAYEYHAGGITDNEWTPGAGGNDYGKIWMWGNNANGQLGLGNTLNVSSPTVMGDIFAWKQVAAGGYHSLFLRETKALWATGANAEGQLGLNDTSLRSSPVKIGALDDWEKITAGRYHNLAIRSDGTLWAWGANWSGQLGVNDVANRSSPTKIGTLNTWLANTKVLCAGYSTSALIKNDGTLWTWGENGFGELGQNINSTVDRSSPVQVGTLNDWKFIHTAGQHSVATKTDGTLWSWGYNTSGQLGDATTITRSSPVQIGSLSNWHRAYGGLNMSYALTNEGILWGWGQGNASAINTDSTLNRSSPVVMGTDSWYDVKPAANSVLLLKIK